MGRNRGIFQAGLPTVLHLPVEHARPPPRDMALLASVSHISHAFTEELRYNHDLNGTRGQGIYSAQQSSRKLQAPFARYFGYLLIHTN